MGAGVALRHDRARCIVNDDEMSEMQTNATIDETQTVNEVMAGHPETIHVFNRFGIDTCCGGGAPIREAAHRDGADARALIEALQAAVGAA